MFSGAETGCAAVHVEWKALGHLFEADYEFASTFLLKREPTNQWMFIEAFTFRTTPGRRSTVYLIRHTISGTTFLPSPRGIRIVDSRLVD